MEEQARFKEHKYQCEEPQGRNHWGSHRQIAPSLILVPELAERLE